ncbi:MAG: SufD family Fe-S cluster assembly protein [Bacteroides sp.]|nr:SufD family Fe-S cluster assembly protein [Bacteroides sp.]MCM1379038.1 SufD family Fe-S cluster assembly protein [Bacteroides sp.]MCM1445654.1 SufD family Fe-S cluster assembly protein [Prevotella sp.]
MSTPVTQYLDLYDSAAELIGNREAERQRLAEAGELDDAFAPTDYGVNLQSDSFAVPEKLLKLLPKGVHIEPLQGKELPTLSGGYDDAETRLNDLLWTNGVLLRVDDGVCCDTPLQLVNTFAEQVDFMAVRRLYISLGRNAAVSLLVCDRTKNPDHRYLSAELIKADLGEGASLCLDFIEESSAKTARRSTLNAALAADSTLAITCATISCGDTRMRLGVDINGPGASAQVNGMVVADGEQRAAYATRIMHHAENTSSNQLFKYVADGQSHCDFDGRIVVDEAARFTDAHQTNRNLLASPGATMHAEPTLEIYCDEVKCSHGAATGQLDERALFYMRQRGIPLEQARRMLMEAFVGDVISSFHIPGLPERLRHIMERRFAGLGSPCADCSLC